MVTLRLWRDDDVAALVDGISGDPEIGRWLEMIPQPYTEEDAVSWIAGAAKLWDESAAAPFAVEAAGSVVGGAGVNWIDRDHGVGDIGYWLRSDARGRGYSTRAVLVVARWVFDLGCERLQLRADSENASSQRVAERAGFVREGIQRSARFNPRLNRRMDFVTYSLLPTDPR